MFGDISLALSAGQSTFLVPTAQQSKPAVPGAHPNLGTERDRMKPMAVFVSVVMVLCCLQAAQPVPGSSAVRLAMPAADFPRPEQLTIAYLPVIFHAQVFGAQEQGWLNELGVRHIEFLRFASGIPLLQAMAAGQVDIAFDGIGPLLIAGHRGLPVKAVAATSKDALALVATERFAGIYAAHQPPPTAFAAFAT